MEQKFDVIIIGGGPAGCTAAMYTARFGFSTLVLERLGAGGQMSQAAKIDNYPGFPEGIDGYSLGAAMLSGAERFGVQTLYSEVKAVSLQGTEKRVDTGNGSFAARAVIVATGAGHKHLGLEGEPALVGKGVSYCAACDAAFYRDKTVAVVGGGNSAAASATVLSRIAKKVYLIHRRDSLKAAKISMEALRQAENVEILWNRTVTELLHEDKLTGVKLQDTQSGQERILGLDGLFISIGMEPVTELFRGQVVLDSSGYIVADETTCTNVPGVFAAGDVRTKEIRQIVTATADGAVAAHYVEKYLLS